MLLVTRCVGHVVPAAAAAVTGRRPLRPRSSDRPDQTQPDPTFDHTRPDPTLDHTQPDPHRVTFHDRSHQ